MATKTPAEITRDRARTDIDTLKRMYPEIRARAFAVMGVEDFNKLARIQESVAKLGEGGNWDKLRNQIADELGGDSAATQQHAETVLRTNGFQAFASARYRKQQATKDVFPYLKYVTMDDGKVRDTHAKLDGVILPADDPFWKDHYPPWDYNCRCMVIQLTKRDAEEEVAVGEGKMWNEATRQDFMAQNRGKDATRDFHFRPDSLDLDMRDIAAAKGRTPQMMEDFGKLMETRKIGTGEIGANGKELTTSVRDWMWKPVQKDYQAKVLKEDVGKETLYALNVYTGAELAHTVGTRGSVSTRDIPVDSTPKAVIHNHTSGNETLSPDDVILGLRKDIESVEAVTARSWSRVRVVTKSPAMIERLDEWKRKFDAIKDTKSRAQMIKFHTDWISWLEAQIKYGYILSSKGRV